MAVKKRKRRAVITLVDNKGNRMHLSGDLTIKELVTMGVNDLRLLDKDTPSPLQDGWWRLENIK